MHSSTSSSSSRRLFLLGAASGTLGAFGIPSAVAALAEADAGDGVPSNSGNWDGPDWSSFEVSNGGEVQLRLKKFIANASIYTGRFPVVAKYLSHFFGPRNPFKAKAEPTDVENLMCTKDCPTCKIGTAVILHIARFARYYNALQSAHTEMHRIREVIDHAISESGTGTINIDRLEPNWIQTVRLFVKNYKEDVDLMGSAICEEPQSRNVSFDNTLKKLTQTKAVDQTAYEDLLTLSSRLDWMHHIVDCLCCKPLNSANWECLKKLVKLLDSAKCRIDHHIPLSAGLDCLSDKNFFVDFEVEGSSIERLNFLKKTVDIQKLPASIPHDVGDSDFDDFDHFHSLRSNASEARCAEDLPPTSFRASSQRASSSRASSHHGSCSYASSHHGSCPRASPRHGPDDLAMALQSALRKRSLDNANETRVRGRRSSFGTTSASGRRCNSDARIHVISHSKEPHEQSFSNSKGNKSSRKRRSC